MSRIKTEIDRALEYYGDDATVFRVVRRAMRVYGPYRYELWPKSKKPNSHGAAHKRAARNHQGRAPPKPREGEVGPLWYSGMS